MQQIKGKLALVTGAAMGMGKLLADKLGADGARLLLVDLNGELLEGTTKPEFEKKGYEVMTYVCDLSDKEAIATMVDWVKKNAGPVQILVNSAGVVFKSDLVDHDDGKFVKTFEINVYAVFRLMQAFLPEMLDADDGHVLNMASASGLMGVANLSAYASSKWAVIGLTESARYEAGLAGKHGVKFTSACPSFVGTGMFEGVKPPLMTPLLTPEHAVDIIYQGFKNDKIIILEPFMVKMTPFLKGVLPMKAYDKVAEWFGVHKAMDNFTGHKPN